MQKDKLVVLFIQETKCSSEISTKLMSLIWKYCLTISIDARRESRGICISWDSLLVALSNMASSLHTISASFDMNRTNIMDHLLNVYGPQSVGLKI